MKCKLDMFKCLLPIKVTLNHFSKHVPLIEDAWILLKSYFQCKPLCWCQASRLRAGGAAGFAGSGLGVCEADAAVGGCSRDLTQWWKTFLSVTHEHVKSSQIRHREVWSGVRLPPRPNRLQSKRMFVSKIQRHFPLSGAALSLKRNWCQEAGYSSRNELHTKSFSMSFYWWD